MAHSDDIAGDVNLARYTNLTDLTIDLHPQYVTDMWLVAVHNLRGLHIPKSVIRLSFRITRHSSASRSEFPSSSPSGLRLPLNDVPITALELLDPILATLPALQSVLFVVYGRKNQFEESRVRISSSIMNSLPTLAAGKRIAVEFTPGFPT